MSNTRNCIRSRWAPAPCSPWRSSSASLRQGRPRHRPNQVDTGEQDDAGATWGKLHLNGVLVDPLDPARADVALAVRATGGGAVFYEPPHLQEGERFPRLPFLDGILFLIPL